METNLHSINKEQKLYVLSEGKGFSCYGFDVVMRRGNSLAQELNESFNVRKGTRKAYEEFRRLIEVARQKNITTGWRSKSELFAPFIGNEGRRVEIEYTWGEKERFIIGKSTGWIPCHIMCKRIDSNGGASVLHDSIKNYKFIS